MVVVTLEQLHVQGGDRLRVRGGPGGYVATLLERSGRQVQCTRDTLSAAVVGALALRGQVEAVRMVRAAELVPALPAQGGVVLERHGGEKADTGPGDWHVHCRCGYEADLTRDGTGDPCPECGELLRG